MSDDNNVLDKAKGTAESSNQLVYSLIALFATLIVAAAFVMAQPISALVKFWAMVGVPLVQ